MLEGGAEAQRLDGLDRVLHAHGAQIEAAVAIGSARLVVLSAERLESVGVIARAEQHEMVARQRRAEIAVDMAALVRIAAERHAAVRVLGEVLGDDVDRACHTLRPVEQRLGSFQDHDALHHGCRQRVNRRGAAVQAVVDAHTVDQPQDVLRARPHERDVRIVEGAVLGADVQTRNGRLQRLRDVQIAAVADLLGRHHIDPRAIALQIDRQILFEMAGDEHLLEPPFADRGLGCIVREGDPPEQRGHQSCAQSHQSRIQEFLPHLESHCSFGALTRR